MRCGPVLCVMVLTQVLCVMVLTQVLCVMVLTQVLCVMVLTHDTHQAAKIERATCRNCGLDYIVQDNLVGSCKCAHNGSTSQV